MRGILDATIIAEHEVEFRVAIFHAVGSFHRIDFDVVLSTPWMVIDLNLSFLAE
jgi:hypothetical protein